MAAEELEFRDLKELWADIQSMETLAQNVMEYIARSRVERKKQDEAFGDLMVIAEAIHKANISRTCCCGLTLENERYKKLVEWYLRVDCFLECGTRLLHAIRHTSFVHPSFPPMIEEVVKTWQTRKALCTIFV